MEAIELGVSTASRSAAAFARKLISQGKVSTSRSWDGPSATAENAYLNTNGWKEFGNWYLGRNSDAPVETKGHYTFPFTDDFKTVSMSGLRAIRQRAGQQDDQGIFDIAGPLFAAVREKVEASAIRSYTFGNGGSVDFELGILHDVTLVEVGEARGHGILVTEQTLMDAINKLSGRSLPAYITHANAQGDRLTSEVGFFSGFYLDGGCEHAPYGPDWCGDKRKTRSGRDADGDGVNDYPETFPDPAARRKRRKDQKEERWLSSWECECSWENRGANTVCGGGSEGYGCGLARPQQEVERSFPVAASAPLALKARIFTAFESFKKYQPETYERLFEMAQRLPDTFGISLVFEAALAWETPEGPLPYSGMESKPDDSLHEFPTVEMTKIQSADFVDNPAATSSLFSEPTQNQQIDTMNTPELVELTTAASDELERRKAAEEAAEGKDKSKTTAAKKKPKKKLSEPDETEETEAAVAEPAEKAEEASESTEVEAQQEVIDDLETRVKKLTATLDKYIAETERLRSFVEGGDIIEEDAAPEIKEELPPTQLKAEAIQKEMEANPKLTRSQALLEVGKKHPEFFTMNTNLNTLN